MSEGIPEDHKAWNNLLEPLGLPEVHRTDLEWEGFECSNM